MSTSLKHSPLSEAATQCLLYYSFWNQAECPLQPWCNPVGDSRVSQSDCEGPECGSIVTIRELLLFVFGN